MRCAYLVKWATNKHWTQIERQRISKSIETRASLLRSTASPKPTAYLLFVLFQFSDAFDCLSFDLLCSMRCISIETTEPRWLLSVLFSGINATVAAAENMCTHLCTIQIGNQRYTETQCHLGCMCACADCCFRIVCVLLFLCVWWAVCTYVVRPCVCVSLLLLFIYNST